MNFSITKFIILLMFITVSAAFNCSDTNCYVTTNEKNQVIFDCSLGAQNSTTVIECTYIATRNKIIISTKDRSYIPVDKIARGALARLVSGFIVDKIFIKNLQFKSLNRDDFDGLINISEMQIENPKTMAPDTFMSLATRTRTFILTVSCFQGNSMNSFESLFITSNIWRLYTENCYKRLMCEYSNCDTKSQETIFKISSSNIVSETYYQISSQVCSLSQSCINAQLTTLPVTKTKKTEATAAAITEKPTKIVMSSVKPINKSDDLYDTLMYIVLILTTINSVIILGILVFLIIWWNKLATSTSNNKHTIVLDDEDDNKYLDSTPYA